MSSFNWNSLDESTFQGVLNKYTNAFKRYQGRYFVLDPHVKILYYFMQDEVRKKGPRGFVELTNCCIVPSDEDDVTFSIQNVGPEIYKLRATDAKERKKWIDRLRACSGSNAASAYTSALTTHKNNPSSLNSSLSSNAVKENPTSSERRANSKMKHHNQTIKQLKEIIRYLETNQHQLVDTIDLIPDDIPLNSLSKEMLLFRSISKSCVTALEDSLTILNKGRAIENQFPSPSNTASTHFTSTSRSNSRTFSLSVNSGTNPRMNPSESGSQNKQSH